MKTCFCFFSFVFIVLLVGCEPDPLPITLSAAPEKLVVSSSLVADSILLISVSKTFLSVNKNALKDTSNKALREEMDKILVKNALVKVEYEGNSYLLDSVEKVPGLYILKNFRPRDNEKVTLDITDPATGASVRSMTKLLPKVKVTKAEIIKRNAVSSMLNISFTDPKNQENWYLLSYYKISKHDNESQIKDLEMKPLNVEQKKKLEYFILHDKNIANEYEGKFLLNNVAEKDILVISFSNISKEYYDFLESRKQSNHLLGSILNEPFNYPTNIIGGYGFFALHSSDLRVLK